jgi:hypothetical protein
LAGNSNSKKPPITFGVMVIGCGVFQNTAFCY